MWRIRTLRTSGIAAAISAIATLGLTTNAARADDVAQPVKAVWHVQEIYLSYFGLTTYYSCDALRDKVRGMLLQLGAHPSSLVAASGCVNLSGPERFPGARLVFAMPRTATPEAVAANASDEKRAALLAKMQRKGQPALEAGEFDAIRKVVALNTKDPPGESSSGDCELVEQVRDQVIKKIDARIVKDDVFCTPYQGTIGNRKLHVETLFKAGE